MTAIDFTLISRAWLRVKDRVYRLHTKEQEDFVHAPGNKDWHLVLLQSI